MNIGARTPRFMAGLLLAFVLLLPLVESAQAYDRVPPFEVFDPTPGRHRLQHLLFLAETAVTASSRGRAYRHLGEMLTKIGHKKEALRAYEAGGLQGDGTSAQIAVEAYLAGRYKIHALGDVVVRGLLPAAEAGRVDAALLIADLLSSGKIKGKLLGTANQWLQRAADGGSGTAVRRLAESAERNGDIRSASALYARFDRKLSKADRALRQARVYYLGDGVKRSSRIALAWLDYAGRIDSQSAGQMAARLYRQSTSIDDRAVLLKLAKAGGIANPDGGGGFSAQLAAATTPEARAEVLLKIKEVADTGNAEAADIYWRALTQDGASREIATPYLLIAVAGGNEHAIEEILKLLARIDSSDPDTPKLVATLETVGASGNISALKALGAFYATGGALPPDQDKSFQFYRQAADAGDADSQLRMGLFFSQQGLPTSDIALARQYLSAAAAQGSASAKAYLETLPTA